VQQFNLTDGSAFVIGGVTNINVPGDTDTVAGQITAELNLQASFVQLIVGSYLFKLSSPAGHFTPLTNSFAVTNYPYAQQFTGTVVSNGVAVPYAIVLLLSGQGNNDPVGGTVANSSGLYTMQAQPENYGLVAVQSNCFANTAAAGNIFLSSGANIQTNLSIMAATRNISGTFVDTNSPSVGLPGLFVAVETTNDLLAICFTDTNGNFSAGVNAAKWKINALSASLAFHGYVGLDNKVKANTTGGSVSGLTIALPKATALFYGTVIDDAGSPLAGEVAVYAEDQNVTNNYNGTYESDGYTDANGNFVTGVVGSSNTNEIWNVNIDNASSFPNYDFSQTSLDQNGGTNMAVGETMPANFTAALANFHITGNVQYEGNPVSGLEVNAFSQDANNYQAQATTDSDGNYSLTVANDTWFVNLNCQGGDNSLSGIITSGNFQCPCGTNEIIDNDNVTANFTVLGGGTGLIYDYLTNTSGGPIAGVNVYAQDCNGDNYSTSTGDNGYYSMEVSNGVWNVGVDCNGLNLLGYNCVNSTNVTIENDDVEQNFTAQSSGSSGGPLQVTTDSLPEGTNGSFYNQTMQASGGQPPYSWSIPSYSANPPANLTLSPGGVLSGILATNGTFYFYVRVTDSAANTADSSALELVIVYPPPALLQITNVSLPNGTVGAAYSAQLGATGGQEPYNCWSLANGSANLPPGLSLDCGGLISGKPTTNGSFSFIVQATDANFTTTIKPLGIFINPRPSLSQAIWLASQFQMRLAGASNQNYTVQKSTSLSSSNWITLFITNNTATNSFLVTDPNATNKQSFYRILIGP
jgi:hypothetical protein